MPAQEPVDWSTVKLDPAAMTERDREGFEYLIAFLAAKMAEHRQRASE
jgi:hypothetical protein